MVAGREGRTRDHRARGPGRSRVATSVHAAEIICPILFRTVASPMCRATCRPSATCSTCSTLKNTKTKTVLPESRTAYTNHRCSGTSDSKALTASTAEGLTLSTSSQLPRISHFMVLHMRELEYFFHSKNGVLSDCA